MGRRPKSERPLKELIAEAARRVVEKDGPDALNVRTAAKAAGATPNAPLFYYPGKTVELLAVVAIEGFEQLNTLMERATVTEDSMECSHEVIARYVRFGVENEQVYRTMFHAKLSRELARLDKSAKELADGDEPRMDPRAIPTLRKLQALKDRAFNLFVLPLEALERGGDLRRGDPRDFALAVAALAHGLVGEFIDEQLWLGKGGAKWSKTRREVTRLATDALLHGIVRKACRDGSIP